MNEGAPTPPPVEPGEMITSVPGFNQSPAEVAKGLLPSEVPQAAPVGSRENPVIADTGFRGDPRRVIGHPSNQMSEMGAAVADQMRAAQNAQQPEQPLAPGGINAGDVPK